MTENSLTSHNTLERTAMETIEEKQRGNLFCSVVLLLTISTYGAGKPNDWRLAF